MDRNNEIEVDIFKKYAKEGQSYIEQMRKGTWDRRAYLCIHKDVILQTLANHDKIVWEMQTLRTRKRKQDGTFSPKGSKPLKIKLPIPP